MQNLAKYVFSSGKWFEPYHFITAKGPIRADYDTDITAVAFVIDPELGEIDTPNGHIQFLQIVGLTTAEFEVLQQDPVTTRTEELIQRMRTDNPLLVTDLNRKISV